MYVKPGKPSERCRLESREEFEARDECKDHIGSGVSYRATINDEEIERRELARIMGVSGDYS